MFTAEPPPSKLDLHFSVGSIPVRVHPLFWLVSIVFGALAVRGGGTHIFIGMVLWTAAVFISILIHELGHAWSAKAYGWPPRIVLHTMGGLAIYTPTGQSRRSRMVIGFMGPGAGFILGALVLGGILLSGHSVSLLGLKIGGGTPLMAGGGRLELFLVFMLYVNIFWGLLNLVPVQPLDGGGIARAIIEKFRPRDSWATALKVGVGAAGAVAVAGLVTQNLFLGIMFGMLAYQNYQMLQQIQAR